MPKDLFLGIDIGSITIKTVLLDANKALCFETYTRIKGDPFRSLERDLKALSAQFSEDRILAAGITGSNTVCGWWLVVAR